MGADLLVDFLETFVLRLAGFSCLLDFFESRIRVQVYYIVNPFQGPCGLLSI